ncbi:MAG: glycosyltransferase family 2 protein [Solobacterium sp.]|nr:glycosyltransferase family 2 protein [Solobacterium sp.]
MNKNLISVIVPVYNAQRYLSRCLDSILAQTYQNIEVIVIDDGSKDESYSLCLEYAKKDSRVVVLQEENHGAAMARNLGLDHCSGDYICFVDADDAIVSNFIEILYANLKKYDAQISCCNYVRLKEGESEPIIEEKQPVHYENGLIYLSQKDWTNAVILCNKLFDAKLFSSLRFPVHTACEDELVIHYLLNEARLVDIAEPLYLYYYHDQSVVNTYQARNIFQGYLALYDRIKFYEQKGLENEKKVWLERLLFQIVRYFKNYERSAFWDTVFKARLHKLFREYPQEEVLMKHKLYGEAKAILQQPLGNQSELISIIVPVYNAENYLDRLIESVLNQTYGNFELLLVNDRSTDSSYEMIQNYARKDSRIRVFTKKNGGRGSARNLGLDEAKGNYITFLDSDDYLSPLYLETLYVNLVNAGADISVCDAYWVKDGEIVKQTPNLSIQIYERPLSFMSDVSWNNAVVVWNKLYKKELWEKHRFDVQHPYEDEAIMHYIIGEAKKLVYTNEKLYYYVQRESSFVHTQKPEELLKGHEALLDRIEYLNQLGYLKEKTDWLIRAQDHLIGIYKRFDDPAHIKSYRETMKQFLNHYQDCKEIQSGEKYEKMMRIIKGEE